MCLKGSWKFFGENFLELNRPLPISTIPYVVLRVRGGGGQVYSLALASSLSRSGEANKCWIFQGLFNFPFFFYPSQEPEKGHAFSLQGGAK